MGHNTFSKDFLWMAVGQVISLFGNAVVRFALPLYLLNMTGSPALYGTVTACAFIPAILLSPLGGIVADRVNKRNIMVALDFFTAALMGAFLLLMSHVDLTVLLTVTLMILYGIAGAYQPSVQASVPVLVEKEGLMAANAVINMVSQAASLFGPVLGGVVYSIWGLTPVLAVSGICFFLSAVMELFIHIPHVRQEKGGNIWKTVGRDFKESLFFIRREKPVVGKVLLVVCAVNFFLSAMIIVGLPYVITEVLSFESSAANRLYGFAEGALAMGGLAGGIGAGIWGGRLTVSRAGELLSAATLCVFPMGISLFLFPEGAISYGVTTVCCALLMVFSTMFTIQMMAFVQEQTPGRMTGKVISVILTVSMCAQPLGNAMYGILFEWCEGLEYAVVLLAGLISLMISLRAGRIFREMGQDADSFPGRQTSREGR
ncbi:MAG: MFS transporter [Lachnospiraceae bacterium]|jgi:MFS family permease|nr:MFS transporter [Lachnospiraceae bacterium]